MSNSTWRMDLQHFEGAVCLASFGQLWSGSPRQVTESSIVSPSGFRHRSPQENFFGGTFRSISAVDLLIYDFSVHMVLTIYTRTALQFEFIEWPSTWQSTHLTTTRDVQSCPFHRLCLLFSHRTALFRFNGTPWNFFTTLCLVSSGFLANLFLISFCVQNRLRGNHCLRSPSFGTVCTFVLWESDGGDMKKRKGKKGWGMNRLQIKITVLKFSSSCYLRLLAAPDKTLEHLCKSCDNRKRCLVL